MLTQFHNVKELHNAIAATNDKEYIWTNSLDCCIFQSPADVFALDHAYAYPHSASAKHRWFKNTIEKIAVLFFLYIENPKELDEAMENNRILFQKHGLFKIFPVIAKRLKDKNAQIVAEITVALNDQTSAITTLQLLHRATFLDSEKVSWKVFSEQAAEGYYFKIGGEKISYPLVEFPLNS